MAEPTLTHIPKDAYVYEIIVDGLTRYVGKGTGKRAANHERIARRVNQRRAAGEIVKTQKFYNRLAKAIRNGELVGYRIIQDGMSSAAALKKEIETIAGYERGQLWNELPGGQGGDAEHFKRNWRDPEIRARMLLAYQDPNCVAKKKANVALQWSDPTARERNRVRTSEQWRDPEFRERRTMAIKASDNPDRRRKISEAAKLRWADPAFRAKQVAAIKEACSTPEAKAKRSRNSKAMWAAEGAREEYGSRISEGQRKSGKLKALWNDPSHRERRRQSQTAAWASDYERREWQSVTLKALWATPEFRQRMLRPRRRKT